MIFMLSGAAILIQTQKMIFRKRDKKKSAMLTDKETVKFLEDFGDVKTLRELQKETVKDAPLDKWANFRGPRPDEDKSMVTFEKMKAEANKVIKEKNDKLRHSDDWKKSQEMQGKWIETIRRQQEAVMKKK